MNIVRSLKAFLYCIDRNTNSHAVLPHIDVDWHTRWLALQTLLEASCVPIYMIAADEMHRPECLTATAFDFAASAHSEEQLTSLLSVPSTANPTSILVGGCYAETLITDVALAALKQGYETFVIWDRVWAISEAGLEAAKARLLQAGAVPTSVDQVLHRWGE